MSWILSLFSFLADGEQGSIVAPSTGCGLSNQGGDLVTRCC